MSKSSLSGETISNHFWRIIQVRVKAPETHTPEEVECEETSNYCHFLFLAEDTILGPSSTDDNDS